MIDQSEIMSLEVARQVFASTDGEYLANDAKYRQSLRYYRNKNDIVIPANGKADADGEKQPDAKDPLRRRHNSRVSSNFQELLVDQKAAYTGSTPPTIDVGSDADNKAVEKALGDMWQSTIQQLMIDASLAGVAWLHVWHDDTGKLKYAVVKPNEVVPIYKSTLTKDLQAVRRTYDELDPTDGKVYTLNEYWTADSATFFKMEQGGDYESMVYNQKVAVTDSVNDDMMDPVATIQHGFNGIPFIPFYNNFDQSPDLQKYKGLIDVYDLIYNGFVNDVQDVQQVILVLTNYGGVDLNEFWKNLQQNKAIKLDATMPGDKSGVDKLTIDIPVEARKELLAETFKGIFYQGQGVNPDQLTLGSNLSGVAMKMLYGELELKAGQLESQFRPSVAKLVRFILDDMHKPDDVVIQQTWTRTGIQNDAERADILSKVADHSSTEAVAKANPIIADWQQELKDLQKDEDDKAKRPDPFSNMQGLQNAAKNGAGGALGDNEDNNSSDDKTGVDDE